MALRLATYNIHRCIGADGKEDPQRIADVLRAMDADLVALQEVAYDPETPGDILRFLSRAAGAQAIAEPTLQEGKRRYGNAVLTRLTPLEVRRIDISLRSREPRGASFNWAWPLLRQPSPCWRPTWGFPCGSAGGSSPASPKFWRRPAPT
jgi:endonuclease/exonuclease/phosphatase family metal-dependent hydrolase